MTPISLTRFGIHWFRRDLRVADNAGLQFNRSENAGRTLGFFSFDSQFLSRADFSHHRFAFFLETLKALRTDLRATGGDLLVVDCRPTEAFGRLLHYLDMKKLDAKKQTALSLVTFGRDYEPFARQRDQAVIELFEKKGIAVKTFRDHLIFEPGEIQKPDGTPYKVYSPFARRWFERLHQSEPQTRLAPLGQTHSKFTLTWADLPKKDFPFKDALDHFARDNAKHVSIEIPEAGAAIALNQVKKFRRGVGDYLESRNFPAETGTSRVSIYLKNGSLTTAQILRTLNLRHPHFAAVNGPTQYTKEIAWREFYYHVLYHRPEVEHTTYLPHFANLKWSYRKSHLARWTEGTTGFPLVDAGMRQLNKTGWMHNRMRMVVASFLIKDLLLDYKLGENYFMKMLLDGDLAANNGGWQWAASTGCDPQPYFRIFNPWLQSKKYDPDGAYIRRWIPELRDCPTKELHASDADLRRYRYPKPMISHGPQKVKALALYLMAH